MDGLSQELALEFEEFVFAEGSPPRTIAGFRGNSRLIYNTAKNNYPYSNLVSTYYRGDYMKICCHCKQPNKKYHKNKAKFDGLHNECTDCEREYAHRTKDKSAARAKRYYEKHKTIISESQKEQRKQGGILREISNRERNREKIRMANKVYTKDGALNLTVLVNNMYSGAKARARKQKVPFAITKEHIKELLKDMRCYYFGIELKPASDTFNHKYSPTLDKVIPELGYVPGNIVLCSYKANSIKDKGTLEELQMIVDKLSKFK